MSSPRHPIDQPTRMRVALRGDVALRSVEAYLDRAPQRPSTVRRIERALTELGLERLIRPCGVEVAS